MILKVLQNTILYIYIYRKTKMIFRISSQTSTVKRGKIGHLLTFKSKLKILRSIFCGLFRQKSLYELWDHCLQSLNHWFCHQGYNFFFLNHWCPILPKVELRSDTTLNHQINRKLDFLCERSDTKWSFKKKFNFLMVNNRVIGTSVHMPTCSATFPLTMS